MTPPAMENDPRPAHAWAAILWDGRKMLEEFHKEYKLLLAIGPEAAARYSQERLTAAREECAKADTVLDVPSALQLLPHERILTLLGDKSDSRVQRRNPSDVAVRGLAGRLRAVAKPQRRGVADRERETSRGRGHQHRCRPAEHAGLPE